VPAGAPPLLIADVPWLLYRAFFALPSKIRGAEGRPVNALLGTVNTILGLLAPAESPPPHPPLQVRAVAACTGAEQAAYRVKLYPPYHAHRPPMPPELAEQWQRAPAMLESLGWHVIDGGELEADDAMFSLARGEEEAGGSALLLTADRDLHGAVTDHVEVLQLGRGGSTTRIGVEQVLAQHGVLPEQIPDLIALRGDPSDGIPGARGVGAKTAAELLQAHGSLEGVLDAARASLENALSKQTALRPRIAQTLVEQEGLLRDFKHIATLQRIDLPRPRDRPLEAAAGAREAQEVGMRRLSERLQQLADAGPTG
jgi:5'-3' exonuclease